MTAKMDCEHEHKTSKCTQTRSLSWSAHKNAAAAADDDDDDDDDDSDSSSSSDNNNYYYAGKCAHLCNDGIVASRRAERLCEVVETDAAKSQRLTKKLQEHPHGYDVASDRSRHTAKDRL
jgi:hypothetical protein